MGSISHFVINNMNFVISRLEHVSHQQLDWLGPILTVHLRQNHRHEENDSMIGSFPKLWMALFGNLKVVFYAFLLICNLYL